MTREEALTVLKAFMENPLFSDAHKQAFNIAIHDIKQRHDWDINKLMLVPKTEWEQEPTTKNDLGVDAVSRKELLKIYENRFIELQKLKHLKDNKGVEDRQMGVNYCINILKELPPITPIRPKGHWMGDSYGYICSNCEHSLNDLAQSMDYISFSKPKYCPNCGADMREVIEE